MKYYDFEWIDDATRYCFGTFWSDTIDPDGRWCYWCDYYNEWFTSRWVEEDFARFGGGVWRHEDESAKEDIPPPPVMPKGPECRKIIENGKVPERTKQIMKKARGG